MLVVMEELVVTYGVMMQSLIGVLMQVKVVGQKLIRNVQQRDECKFLLE